MSWLNTYLNKTTKAAPLAAFRILFGLMMFLSIVRFWSYGWIEKFYIQPKFFFSYYGFEFVRPLGNYTYLVFILCGLSALAVSLGYRYRLAIITFFLSFTYIELMDKTTYLNHYYFISLVSFVMIFLPANAYFSLDARKNPKLAYQYVPAWSVDAIKLMLGIVYFYAGLAKLNSDWLIEAMPLKIWLPANYDLPLVGPFLKEKWVIYGFSWAGAIYDLSIPFLLVWRKTRWIAFFLVVAFHGLTASLFPIGMFPYIMIVSTTIFFDPKLHERFLNALGTVSRVKTALFDNGRTLTNALLPANHWRLSMLVVFFSLQLLLPFRHLAYPDELFWTEEGFRFSWRVMLMEKAGYAHFKVVDSVTKNQFYIDNTDFLTPLQEKQMATQPDFVIQYAHFLKSHFEGQGHRNVQVFADSYVALNGRRSQPFIDPNIDLASVQDSFQHKNWILPFNDEIKGL